MSMVQQSFIPGSQWLYIKLYVSEKTSDDILIKVIFPTVRKLQKKYNLERWFFIRYSDPDFHLRIRLYFSNNQYLGGVICLFYDKLFKCKRDLLLWRVQFDTYERELERYGKNLIKEAESIFYIDSECILSIIKKINGKENYRWMIALKLIDKQLSDFCLNINDKQKLMEVLSNLFKAEFGFNEFNSKQFNVKFRENKNIVESVLHNTFDEKEFILLSKSIKKRTKELLPIIEQIKRKVVRKNEINELLKSYLHLTVNRLFQSENRLHEMILYDFMFRYYSSQIAKEKYSKK